MQGFIQEGEILWGRSLLTGQKTRGISRLMQPHHHGLADVWPFALSAFVALLISHR